MIRSSDFIPQRGLRLALEVLLVIGYTMPLGLRARLWWAVL